MQITHVCLMGVTTIQSCFDRSEMSADAIMM